MQADLGNGVSLRYEVHGSGFPLILITGFGATLDLWGADFLAPLAAQFQVITLDNRGSGGSKVADAQVTMADYADDVLLLMDYLNLPKAHVFGISMGGMIALHLAVKNPGRLHKLILGATTCSSKLIRRNPRLIGLFLFPIAPRLSMRAMVSKDFIATHPQLVDQLIAVARANPGSPLTLRRQSAAVKGHDLEDEVAGIRLPTLILAGTDDQIINYENSELLAKKIRSSRLITYPGVGHVFPLERREEVKSAILKFLREP